MFINRFICTISPPQNFFAKGINEYSRSHYFPSERSPNLNQNASLIIYVASKVLLTYLWTSVHISAQQLLSEPLPKFGLFMFSLWRAPLFLSNADRESLASLFVHLSQYVSLNSGLQVFQTDLGLCALFLSNLTSQSNHMTVLVFLRNFIEAKQPPLGTIHPTKWLPPSSRVLYGFTCNKH